MGIDKDKSRSTEAAELRRRAEELLRAKTAEAPPLRTEAESQRLLHELEVHQIELEMQNAQLSQARDEAEKALEKYSELYDFAPVGYFTLDRKGIIRDANFTGATLLGIERSRLIGRSFGQFVLPGDRPTFTDFLGEVFASWEKETCEVALKIEGKRPLHLQIEAVASASAAECRVAVIDITARREAEKLRKSEHQLAEAQRIAHIGSWEWDSTADERSGSDEYHRIFGMVLSTYDSFLQLVHPDDREMVNKAVQETLAHQAPYNVHYRIIRPDGITRVIHARGVAVTDGAGKTVRMIGTAQDITERREMEEKLEILNADIAARASELEAANIELEAFNYTVAHDLRTPLANINGYCQVVQKFCAGHDEECKRYIREIYEATLRMDRLIDTLLKFSRSIHAEIHLDRVDLGAVAWGVADSLERTEPERQVTFRIAEGIKVNGDAGLLRIVLDNLIGNAWKFTDNREGTVIEFGVTEKEGASVYFVRDNGPGFAMADADTLFLPFRRFLKSKVQGHGIGLAMVERIIRRHGGRVWAEGEPGKGATFYFTLAADS
ncbi:MAG: ATP-binding protein [Geobacteraceae bacterium]